MKALPSPLLLGVCTAFAIAFAPRATLADPSPRTGARVHPPGLTVFQEEGGDADFDVFYEDLGNDGQWLHEEGYGDVFQPAVAAGSDDWRPYSDGHWAWTDRGWYWVSDEPFGWACYHYGRWARVVGTGWVWVPGTTWAPAWVSWRQSDDYVGWAPLPPECADAPGLRVSSWCDRYYDIGPAAFAFIRFGDWGRPSYRSYYAPRTQNVNILNRTVNVTNISYNNRVVNNYGPAASVVGRHLGQTVPQYRVNYVANPAARGQFGGHPQGNALNVIAPGPQLRRAATAAPPVKGQLTGTRMDRGWEGVPPADANAWRSRLATGNPPPASLPARPVLPPAPMLRGQSAPGNPAVTGRPGEPALNPHPAVDGAHPPAGGRPGVNAGQAPAGARSPAEVAGRPAATTRDPRRPASAGATGEAKPDPAHRPEAVQKKPETPAHPPAKPHPTAPERRPVTHEEGPHAAEPRANGESHTRAPGPVAHGGGGRAPQPHPESGHPQKGGPQKGKGKDHKKES